MGHCAHMSFFEHTLTDFHAVLTSQEIIQVRNTATCEPATTLHPHEHLQAKAHSKLSSQNISDTSDLGGMGTAGLPASQVPSAIYQTE